MAGGSHPQPQNYAKTRAAQIGSEAVDFGFLDGPAATAQIGIDSVPAMLFLPDGSLLLSDPANQRVRRYDPVTDAVSTFAGTGGNDASFFGALALAPCSSCSA